MIGTVRETDCYSLASIEMRWGEDLTPDFDGAMNLLLSRPRHKGGTLMRGS